MTPPEQFYALCGLLGFCYITFCFLTGAFGHHDAGTGHNGDLADGGSHSFEATESYGKFTDHPHVHVDGHVMGGFHEGHHDALHDHNAPDQENLGKNLSDSAKLVAMGEYARKPSAMGAYIWFLRFFSPLRLALLLFFYGVFGFLILRNFPVWGQFSQLIAIAGAFAVTGALQNIMSSLMSYGEVSKNFDKQDLIGCQAEVTLSVGKQQLGEITYTAGGIKYTGPARVADNQKDLPRFTKVMICDYKDFVFYVKPWDEDVWTDSRKEMFLPDTDKVKDLDDSSV